MTRAAAGGSMCLMRGMIRAIICDDHPIVREGVRLVVNASKDIALEDEASNVRELLEKIRSKPFDVAILDICFPQGRRTAWMP